MSSKKSRNLRNTSDTKIFSYFSVVHSYEDKCNIKPKTRKSFFKDEWLYHQFVKHIRLNIKNLNFIYIYIIQAIFLHDSTSLIPWYILFHLKLSINNLRAGLGSQSKGALPRYLAKLDILDTIACLLKRMIQMARVGLEALNSMTSSYVEKQDNCHIFYRI